MAAQLAFVLALMAQAKTAAVSESLVGKPAPAVALELLDGRRFDLAGKRGKVVLLAFWATWCEPCRWEIPLLLHVEGNNKDVVVIGVTKEPREVVAAFVKGMGWQHFAAAQDLAGGVTKAYGVDLVPRLFVIDQAGTVVRMFRGLPTQGALDRVVESLVKPQSPK